MAEVAVRRGMNAEPPLMRGPEATLFPRGFFNMTPFAMLRQMNQEMERFFGTPKNTHTEYFWTPAVEVKQKNGNMMVTAELPGLTKEDIKVKVIDQTLVLEGERKEEKEEKKEGYYHTERSYGQFYRTVPLPEGAQFDKVAAEFSNGLLEVTIPVPETKHESREVPVQTTPKIKVSTG